jgi:hypothetical protein
MHWIPAWAQGNSDVDPIADVSVLMRSFLSQRKHSWAAKRRADAFKPTLIICNGLQRKANATRPLPLCSNAMGNSSGHAG